jgi:nitrite reductase (NADH) small subunit
MDWTHVGTVDDIPRRGARCVMTPHGRIGVFRTTDDRIFAIENRCPHKGGPLTEGIVHGASVTCPLHNWVLSLETGLALGTHEGSVRTIPVLVEHGNIALRLGVLLVEAA